MKIFKSLYFQVIIAIISGILLGHFYKDFAIQLKPLGDGFLKLILSPTEERFKEAGFHRKGVGLNHLALYAFSQNEVDSYYKDILVANNISSLYQEGPDGDEEYYSVLFEDPDRMKIEITYSPCYCKKESWPNNIESNFDPYKQ